MNVIGKLFLKGLAVVIPVTLTLAILWWFARARDDGRLADDLQGDVRVAGLLPWIGGRGGRAWDHRSAI